MLQGEVVCKSEVFGGCSIRLRLNTTFLLDVAHCSRQTTTPVPAFSLTIPNIALREEAHRNSSHGVRFESSRIEQGFQGSSKITTSQLSTDISAISLAAAMWR